MKEKNLFRLALICSVIGLTILFFISENIETKEIDVGKITDSDTGKEVRVIGKVERLTNTEKVMFLEIAQEKIENIDVILFKEEKNINLKKGDYIELLGEIDEYEGEYNIIANAVKLR
ncbi:hypothetical protein GF361_04780 [Candidatus Woesearchaeota archaeon]|nr:hypothetical protein [Candidatus Woesearchaeota archaeon]